MNFLSKLERFSDSIAVINSNGEFFSYKYLLDSAKLFSGQLEKNNKKLIFILCDNNIESLIGYLGTLLSGNVGVLLASNIKQESLESLIEIYRPDYIWGNFNNDTQDIYNLRDYNLTSYNVNRSITIKPELAVMLST